MSSVPNPADYHVSPHLGFVLPKPLLKLPDYFRPWTDIADGLETLIAQQKVRYKVEKLPLLDTSRLTSHRELRLAHTILSLIGGAYVWERGEEEKAQVVPRCLAVPWCRVSEATGLPPVVNHASYCLANYRQVNDEEELSMDNARLIHYQCGGFDAEWFFLVALQVELDFAHAALQPLLDAQRSVLSGDDERLVHCLNDLHKALKTMQATLSRMHEHCRPAVFYSVFRPYLSGWEQGLVYEGCHGDRRLSYSGGSAAQSSAVQCVDAVLGVTHAKEKGQFLRRMREYMPAPHRAFIVALEHGPSVRLYVQKSGVCRVREAYNQCITSLTNFRSYHVQIVAKYVTLQAIRSDEVSGESKGRFTSLAHVGTGGTGILPFLKGVRDETKCTEL